LLVLLPVRLLILFFCAAKDLGLFRKVNQVSGVAPLLP